MTDKIKMIGESYTNGVHTGNWIDGKLFDLDGNHIKITYANLDITDCLSEKFIARLEKAFSDPIDWDVSPGEENVFVNRNIIIAARAFSRIAPLVKELLEVRKFATSGNWEIKIEEDYSGEDREVLVLHSDVDVVTHNQTYYPWNMSREDILFLKTAGNIATKLDEILREKETK